MRAHPALGALYADLRGPTGSTTRAARFRKLAAIRPEQRESLLLSAEAAMLQADWDEAETALKAVLEDNVTSRACALMADLMRASGKSDVATMWAARAAASPRESDWSDLELDGKAFSYSDAEWARLAYVFGDAGQIIHPRQEAQARDLPANAMLALPSTRGVMAVERLEPSAGLAARQAGLLIDATGTSTPSGLRGLGSGDLGGGGARPLSSNDMRRPPPDYADEDYGY
jgi:HemY protein